MPRNVSGVYSLPSGNPVVTGTIITSTWANSTMTDLATGITESLDRQGRGGMTGALRAADGTIALPGLAFVNETSTGISRPASNVLAFSVAGAERARFTSSAFGIGVTPAVPFHVGGNVFAEARLESTGSLAAGSTGAFVRFAGSNGLSGYVGFGGTAGRLDVVNALNGTINFLTNNIQRVTIGTDGGIDVGGGLSGNRNAFVDLVGDDTYTGYGLRMIRENTGANADSRIATRGTGALIVEAQDAGIVSLRTNGVERLRLKSSGQLRLVPLAADPGGLEDGDIWYNSTTGTFRRRRAGVTENFA